MSLCDVWDSLTDWRHDEDMLQADFMSALRTKESSYAKAMKAMTANATSINPWLSAAYLEATDVIREITRRDAVGDTLRMKLITFPKTPDLPCNTIGDHIIPKDAYYEKFIDEFYDLFSKQSRIERIESPAEKEIEIANIDIWAVKLYIAAEKFPKWRLLAMLVLLADSGSYYADLLAKHRKNMRV